MVGLFAGAIHEACTVHCNYCVGTSAASAWIWTLLELRERRKSNKQAQDSMKSYKEKQNVVFIECYQMHVKMTFVC
jgi:hypothetical protein